MSLGRRVTRLIMSIALKGQCVALFKTPCVLSCNSNYFGYKPGADGIPSLLMAGYRAGILFPLFDLTGVRLFIPAGWSPIKIN
ncbi:hypothetical protein Dda3937_04468 [Dickeya dadantii 3937]|uniref:Uncharacterized protein n=1 Tax=Dickeya dadantii (strain 3937) TaxID=198628 RepID=E0SLU7_DICD3|nr:hypothetical protein Dda3937_04468 [Dickeya dadantii 3937]